MTHPAPAPPPMKPPHRWPAASPDDDLIDVRGYVLLLWRKGLWIAVVALVGAALAGGASWLNPDRYEAALILGVSPPKPGETSTTSAGHLAAAAMLAQSQTVLMTVMREFKLDAPPHNLTLSVFQRWVVTVKTVADANLVQIFVQLRDADLAARVANRIAEVAQQLAQTVSDSGVGRVRDDLQKSLDEAAARLTAAQADYERFRKEAQIELLRTDIDSLLRQRGTLNGLFVDIESERARVARVNEQLAARERIGAVTQSINSNPTLMEAARQAGRQGTDLLGLQMKSEYVDEVYQRLDEELTKRQSNLASLEKQRAQLVSELKLDRAQLSKLSELYQKESILARLEMERDLARRAYMDASSQHQGAKLQATGRSPILLIVDRAVPPTEPLGRGVGRNALLGLIAGLMAGALGVLAWAALGPRSPHATA